MQTNEVRNAVEEKLKTASAQRDENLKKMVDRLKEHVSQQTASTFSGLIKGLYLTHFKQIFLSQIINFLNSQNVMWKIHSGACCIMLGTCLRNMLAGFALCALGQPLDVDNVNITFPYI